MLLSGGVTFGILRYLNMTINETKLTVHNLVARIQTFKTFKV